MSLDFSLDSPLVYVLARSLDFFIFCLFYAFYLKFLNRYLKKAVAHPRDPLERREAREIRARRGPKNPRALGRTFLARLFFPFRRGQKALLKTQPALGDEAGLKRSPLARVPSSRLTTLAPDAGSGGASFLSGALLSRAPRILGDMELGPKALSLPRAGSLASSPWAAEDSRGLGAPPPLPRADGEILGARAWSLHAFWEGKTSVEAALFPAASGGFSPPQGARAFPGDSLGERRPLAPSAVVFPLPAESYRGEVGLHGGGDCLARPAQALFPSAAAPLFAHAEENLSPAEAPTGLAPFSQKRPAPVLSLAPPILNEKEAPSTLLGLIRGRLAREGVDLNNLSLSPLKMAGALTGQALLGLVRRAVAAFNSPAREEEEAQEPASPPPLEDFASARHLWDKLQKESVFWRFLKESPALSPWRE
ncbi:MAG: hypothetical protein LBO66_13250, partial [Deltaproteobacteria bacterium]|nr:hypothetical protein [Deltaproteobacteria bacterium]